MLPFQCNFASVETCDDVGHDIMILARRKNNQLKIPEKKTRKKAFVVNLNIGVKFYIEGLV